MNTRRHAPYILLVLAAIFCAQTGEAVYNLIFSNFLAQVFNFTAEQRGNMEFPRELPGFLTVFVVGGLFFFKEIRMAAFAMILMGIGAGALAFSSTMTIWQLVFWVMLASLGQHILLGVVDAIVMHSALPENRSLRLGQMKALTTAAGLLAAFFVWIKWEFNTNFSVDFIVCGSLAVIGGLLLTRVKLDTFPEHKSWRERIVFKRAYIKYYLLEVLFGIRKQVYMTFGFWLMVSSMGCSPLFIGKTLVVAGIVSLAFRPAIGKAIQMFGEKKILMMNSAVLFFVCFAYAFSMDLFSKETALIILTGCFVIDNLMFACEVARTTYIARICEKKEDITPSIYMGLSINHVFSIIFAVIGGMIWTKTGCYQAVFMISAVVTILSGVVASTLPPKNA